MKESSMWDASIQFDAFILYLASDERLVERGFNQAERLASYLAEQVKSTCSRGALPHAPQ